MGIEIIRVRRSDTIASLSHLLENSAERDILIQVPFGNGRIVSEQVDLARIKQAAVAKGINLGLVTLDGRVRESARVLRIPTYSTLFVGRARHARERAWWLPAERRIGEPTKVSDADKRAMNRRLAAKPRWLMYGYRYVVIVAFFIILAGLFVASAYSIPRATITFKPEIRAIEITEQIVADPRIAEDEASGVTVPGRLLIYSDKWQTTVQPTGVQDVPAQAARGLVTFANRVPTAATIPAGTRVSTSTGTRIIFQTMQPVDLPARIGAEVDVEVVALELGAQGNLPADRINRIEGTLAPQLNVRNLFPTDGGADQRLRSVSIDDMDRLRDHVIETLFAQAKADMEASLDEGEVLAEDSLRLVAIYDETYSHFLNETTDELAFEMRAELHGTAVNAELALGLIDERIRSTVPAGYRLLEDSITTEIGELQGVDAQGRVSLSMEGYGLVAAEIRLGDTLDTVRGQEIDTAEFYLADNLPLRENPDVSIWPARFGRMPYLESRMRTVIDTNLE